MSDTSITSDDPHNTNGERVKWERSPVKESPHSKRPLSTLFSLFTHCHTSDDKFNNGFNPTDELWDQRKPICNTENTNRCIPTTPVQQRTHTTRKKRRIKEAQNSNSESSEGSSVSRLVNAFRTFLPDSLHIKSGKNLQELHSKHVKNNSYKQNCLKSIKKGCSESFFHKTESLDTFFKQSDNSSNNNTQDISSNCIQQSVSCSLDSRNTAETFSASEISPQFNEELLNNNAINKIETSGPKIYPINTIDQSKNIQDSLYQAENTTSFIQNNISDLPFIIQPDFHTTTTELCEAVSFFEEDFAYTSFSDDMLDTPFTDDILDEEMEEVLSALDTYRETDLPSDKSTEKTNKYLSLTDKLICKENKNDSLKLFVKDNSIPKQNHKNSLESLNSFENKKDYLFVIFLEQDNRMIQLRQDWFFTPVEIGDNLYIHGQYDENGICIIDNQHSFVILNPDYLISCTSVASSYSCIRKTIIRERVKILGDTSKSQIYGKILHCLFQLCLENNNFSISFLEKKTQDLVLSNLESLNEVSESIENAMDYIRQKFTNLQDWASRYLSNIPGANSYIETHQQKLSDMRIVSINKLLKIEEHIWSPKYGLKGNIDATIQIVVKSGSNFQYMIVPFELKTGNNTKVMEHRAQTILYTLLLSQHYEKGETIQVFAIHNEIRGLIITRNNIAKYLKSYESLPYMLKNTFTCKRCPVREPCFANESGTGETSGLGHYFDEKTNHITFEYYTFFQHWNLLLSKEENETFRFKKELWTITSKEREEYGRCLCNLKIKNCDFISSKQEILENINRYTYTFEKHYLSSNENPFLDSEISCGDYIIVSDEKGHFALARGNVIKIEPNSITVSVNQRLYSPLGILKDFSSNYNQTSKDSFIYKTFENNFNTIEDNKNVLYRIDKDEFRNGMSLARDNLTKLLYLEDEKRRRELIINLSPPKFNSEFTGFLNIPEYEQLNNSQKLAVSKVMTALDYALILGMPGTGKSTTIACLIQILIANNKTVLLASYTHSAIDNILLKLNIKRENVLRLGSIERIHLDIRKKVITEEYVIDNFESFQLKYIKPSVVATTCLGITHSIFSKRTFDYCIIDEASQIVLPICIGPLRFAEKFILVGDHYQLPPLESMETSLFKLLSDANPLAIVSLEYQYRMNKDIMLLSNTLIYNGKLKSGDERTSCKFLDCSNFFMLDTLHLKKEDQYICNINECWIKKILEPGLSVIFANTDYIPAPESRKGDKIQNDTEVELLKQIIICLLNQGILESNIAVLSVYRSQIKLIRYHLKHFKAIEINTADSFQGRDKDCIIISFVRSNDKNEIGSLLRDWRRLNVAFTRAKSKLIFFGSKITLRQNDIFDRFFCLLEEKHWIYNLPKDAHLLHNLDSLQISYQTDVQKSSKKISTCIEKNYPVLQTIVHGLGPF
ncbi:hypothetical protein PCANB_002595 [Pneumocystis canis]|nr:hypothetical protein PCANB_002595 [Pneumocystis canis]